MGRGDNNKNSIELMKAKPNYENIFAKLFTQNFAENTPTVHHKGTLETNQNSRYSRKLK